MVDRRENLVDSAIVGLLKPQRDFVANASRFCWVNWTRQFVGKSFAAGLRSGLRGVGIGPGMQPRTPRDQFLISASQRQCNELGEKVRLHLKAMRVAVEAGDWDGDVPLALRDVFGEIKFSVHVIQLAKFGTKIVCLPASAYSSVGFTGDISFDEFAKHKNNRLIYRDLYPTVVRVNGCIDMTSTPEGKQDMFYQLRKNEQFWHSTCTIEDAKAFGARTLDGRPIDIEAVREQYDDEEYFRSQFMCEFIDEATAFLTLEQISSCEDDALKAPLRDLDEVAAFAESYTPDHPLYLGYDIGRKHDLSVIWLDEEIAGILVTVGVLILKNVTFRRQREILYRLLPKVSRAAIDATGLGSQLAEEAEEDFGSKVEPVVFTPDNKSMIAHRLKSRVEDRTKRIPNDLKVRNDWHSIQKRTTAAGREQFDGERTADGHADMFWAGGLAIYAASESPLRSLTEGRIGPDRRSQGEAKQGRRRGLAGVL